MKIKLHWQIIIGLVLGLIYGIISASMGWGLFTKNWIVPFGDIFLNLLKLIAVPLVISSLITGVASLADIQKLSRIGGKTIAIYISTTAIAVTIGLLLVNSLQPGKSVPQELQAKLQATYEAEAGSKVEGAETVKQRGPLQIFVDMVPSNFFDSAADNGNMLQIVFVSICCPHFNPCREIATADQFLRWHDVRCHQGGRYYHAARTVRCIRTDRQNDQHGRCG